MVADHPIDKAPRRPDDLDARFAALVACWKRECRFESSSTKLIQHPAYQEIIAMGEQVVPLLLREMERAPNHWSHALQSITHANPVDLADAGRVTKIAAAWVAWGRACGLLA